MKRLPWLIVVLLAVAVFTMNLGFTTARSDAARHKAAADSAQLVADSALKRADASDALSALMRDSVRLVVRRQDVLRRTKDSTARALALVVAEAETSAHDTLTSRDSLVALIDTLASRFRADSVADEARESGWLAERLTTQATLAQDSLTIRDTRQALLSANAAHSARITQKDAEKSVAVRAARTRALTVGAVVGAVVVLIIR